MFAAVGLAAAVVVAIALATPASAGSLGGGGKTTLKSWDTDNLRFGNYSARSFAIPHLDSGERGSHAACGSGVVDGFFQLDPDVRNDLPILEVTVPASGTPAVAHRAAGTCSEFVTEQMTAVNGGRGNGLYWLDSQGVLRRGLPSHTTGRNYRTQRWSLGSQTYQSGRFRIDESVTSGSYGFGGYAARIDYYTGSASLANAEFRGAGNVSFAVPHSIELVANTQKSGSVYTWAPSFPASAGVTAATAVHLQARDYLSLCPSGFHPRGEDAARRIGNGTGRTLSSLTDATKTRLADQYWCRSDARKQIWYEPEFTSRTCGPDPRPTCPAGVTVPTKEFQAYGRVGCFFTAQGLDKTEMQRGSRAIQGTIKNTCSYMYPIPQCTENGTKKPIARAKLDSLYVAPINSPGVFPFASDGSTACDTNPRCTDSGSKRDMTDAELQAYRTARGASFVPASDGSTPCAAASAQAVADFTADACVTAILEIFENRPKGFNAEPGIQASHRTQTADAANPAYDLDVAAAHPGTASPPRAASDPSGCADGTESRADHGTAVSAARKNSAAAVDAVLPTSSAASVSTHPPHSKAFASAGTDYTGTVRNIAHRYASRVAENTCAAKKAEAELVLALGRARADMFSRAASGSDLGGYAARYAADVESNRKLFSNASPRGYKEQLEAVVADASVHRGYWLSWFNTNKAALVSRATDKKTAGENFKSVLDTARANHKRTTDAVALRSFSSGSCVAHWDGEISRIAGVFSSADAAFATAINTSKNAYHNSYDNYLQSTFSATTAGPTSSESVSRSSPFFITAISITSYYCNQGEGSLAGTNCQRAPTTERVRQSYFYNPRQNCINFVNASEGLSASRKAELIRSHCNPQPTSAVGYRYVTVTTTYPPTAAHRNYSRSAAQTVTYTTTGIYNGATNPVSSSCPAMISKSWTSEQSEPSWPNGHCTPPKSQAARYYEAVGASPSLPSAPTSLTVASYPSAPAAVPAHKAALLGKYNPAHTDRNDLENSTASARDTAADNLGTLTSATSGAVGNASFAASAVSATYGLAASRTSVETEAGDYKTAYTGAYNSAYSAALSDMGSTAATTSWDNFAWSYDTGSLAWGGYLADENQPARSRGCYLIDVAADGKVAVQTARMDFETGQYAVGETYSQLSSGDRNCKVRRTRTPELILKYQPANPAGTDGGLAAGYFHTGYQPNPADERFKLAAETEVFAVRAKVADSPPVFCGTTLPADGYLSHTAGQMASVPAAIAKDSWRSAAQLTTKTTILRPSSDAPAVTTDHCFARPRLTAADKPRLVVFDDTAHSDMNLVYLQKDPTDTTGINLFTGGPFTKYALETYRYPGDNSQQSVFYGAIWEPPDALGSSTGWNILDDNNPNTTLETKIKNRIVARDKPAVPNLPAEPASQTFEYVSAMGFNIGFLDCRPDVENVEFVGNITNATQASNQHNDYAGIKTSNSYPMSAPVWYYPAWSDLKENSLGQPRIRSDGSTVAVGERSGIYTHPQSARYGWVMKTVNHIGIDKQPISAFRNLPDVRRRGTTANPARPADVTLEDHRQVCFGDRTALTHYTSSAATADPLGHSTDNAPQQAVVVWSAHNPICDNSDVCDTWQTRCYRNAQTPAEAEQVDCPPTGQPLPADTTRYPDKAMVDANIVRVITDSDLSDTETAAAEAAKLISYKAEVSDGTTTQPRWPWLVPGKQNIFDCETRWWYCLRTKVTLHGIDQYEWLKTRQLRIAFQYTLPKWGNVLVSTLDRETEDEQAVKVAVNILIQTVRIGL